MIGQDSQPADRPAQGGSNVTGEARARVQALDMARDWLAREFCRAYLEEMRLPPVGMCVPRACPLEGDCPVVTGALRLEVE